MAASTRQHLEHSSIAFPTVLKPFLLYQNEDRSVVDVELDLRYLHCAAHPQAPSWVVSSAAKKVGCFFEI